VFVDSFVLAAKLDEACQDYRLFSLNKSAPNAYFCSQNMQPKCKVYILRNVVQRMMITISEDDFTGGVFISLPVNMQVQNFGLA
jgi:hypothetical protein